MHPVGTNQKQACSAYDGICGPKPCLRSYLPVFEALVHGSLCDLIRYSAILTLKV